MLLASAVTATKNMQGLYLSTVAHRRQESWRDTKGFNWDLERHWINTDTGVIMTREAQYYSGKSSRNTHENMAPQGLRHGQTPLTGIHSKSIMWRQTLTRSHRHNTHPTISYHGILNQFITNDITINHDLPIDHLAVPHHTAYLKHGLKDKRKKGKHKEWSKDIATIFGETVRTRQYH